MSTQPKARLTPEEYLAIERAAEYKNEFFNGEIFAMTGASRQHNQITVNFVRVLGNQLLESPCNVYASEMRVKAISAQNYMYPDVVVTCGQTFFEDQEMDTLLNPKVLIEVLSPSTAAFDRAEKFAYYKLIESLTDYVLVNQKPYRVEHFVKQEQGRWTYYDFTSADEVLRLDSVGCEVLLKDIYLKVE
jgi:Uma2 family endonuclease